MPGNVLPQYRLASIDDANWPDRTLPAYSFAPSGWLILCLATGAIACGALGIYIGFFVVPVESYRGDLHRIVYIHVPSTWMAILLYFVVALCAGGGIFSGSRLLSMMAQATAPTGTMFAFMALWTGALWGKPVWGAWWVWDMRLIADGVLLLLYLAIAVVHAGVENPWRADRIVAWIVLPGAVIVLATLASVALYPLNPGMLAASEPETIAIRNWTGAGLLAVSASFLSYSGAVVLRRLRAVTLERLRHIDWEMQPPWRA